MSNGSPPRGILDHLVPPVAGASSPSSTEAGLRRAAAALAAGNLAEAEAAARAAAAAAPRDARTHDLLGVVLIRQRRMAEAAAVLREAARLDRKNPDVLFHLAVPLAEGGKFSEAVEALRRAIKLRPRWAEAWYNLGLVHGRAGAPTEARRAFEKAVSIDPRHVAAWNNLGAALLEANDRPGAERAFRAAIAADPKDPVPRNNLAGLLIDADRLSEAEAEAEASLAVRPTAGARYALGRLGERRGRPAEAEAHYRAALALAPGMVMAAINLGNVLRRLERVEESLELNRTLAAAHPAWPEVLNNYAISLLESSKRTPDPDRAEALRTEALGIWRRALAGASESDDLLYNVLTLLDEAGRDDEALALVDELIARNPRHLEARFLRGLSLLRRGRFAEGCDAYVWDWQRQKILAGARPFAQPWRSGESIPPGKRLLVWGDQGLGDQMLYAFALSRLGARAGQALIECDPRLVATFRRSFPDLEVVASAIPPDPATGRPDIACQAPLSTLMAHLGPWPDGLPRSTGYLMPDPDRVADARLWLETTFPNRRRVGISWRSIAKTRVLDGTQKSLGLDSWGPILGAEGVAFVNLQYGETDADIAQARALHGVDIATPPGLDRYSDVEGMMALIAALDLTVTVSNVTAHYAGAQGSPCLLLVRQTPFWYWGREGDGVPVYASVRAFRQPRGADWMPAVAAAAAALRQRLS